MTIRGLLTKSRDVISFLIIIILLGMLGLALSEIFNLPFWSQFLSLLGTSAIIAGIVGAIAEIWLHTYAKNQITEQVIKELSQKHHDTIAELMTFGLSVWLKREDFTIVGLHNEEVSQLYESNLLREFSEPVTKIYNIKLTYLGPNKNSGEYIDIKENDIQLLTNTWGYDNAHMKYVNKNGVIKSFIFELYGSDKDFYINNGQDEIEVKLSKTFQYKLTHYDISGRGISLKSEVKPVKVDRNDFSDSSKMSFEDISKALEKYKVLDSISNDESNIHIYILYDIDKSREPKLLYTWDIITRGLKPHEMLKIEYTSIRTYLPRDYYYVYTKALTISMEFTLINFNGFQTRIEPYVLPRNSKEIISESNRLQINYPVLPNAGVLIIWNKEN